MSYFNILNKQTDAPPEPPLNYTINYFIDKDLNVWEVFKGDGEVIVEKNPNLYVQFTKKGDMNRVQKMKADLVKIESGTHGFDSNGNVTKDGMKVPPIFTNTQHKHSFVNTNAGVKFCTICKIEQPLKYIEP